LRKSKFRLYGLTDSAQEAETLAKWLAYLSLIPDNLKPTSCF